MSIRDLQLEDCSTSYQPLVRDELVKIRQEAEAKSGAGGWEEP
jgi:hypothetical protein